MSADDLYAALKWVAGAWVALLSWVGVTQIARINTLERDKADRDSTTRTFGAVFERIDEHQVENRDVHREIANKLDDVNKNLSKTNTLVAGLVGVLKGNGTISGDQM